MSDEKNRMLLLDSLNMPSVDEPNYWGSIGASEITNYINKIETSKGLDGENRDALRAMVSGIPTPWARMMFTRSAVLQDKKELGNSILDECYKAYKSEWRGLMAAYVLRPDSFKFSEPVNLTGRKVEANGGEMSLLNLYGEMLFKEAPLWALKSSPYNPEGDNPAVIQILYYNKKDEAGRNTRVAVGASSPYTMLFSSVGYSMKGAEMDVPWIDNEGKFCDPTNLDENKISMDDIQRLHSFIHNVCVYIRSSETQQPDPDKYYLDYFKELCSNNKSLNYEVIKGFIDAWSAELGRWDKELAQRLFSAGRTTNTSIPISVSMPYGPMTMLMNNEHTFYFTQNRLFSTREKAVVGGKKNDKENEMSGSVKENIPNIGEDITGGNNASAQSAEPVSNSAAAQEIWEISSNDILMDSEYAAAWKSSGDPQRDLSKSPVFYLKTADGEYYFALPFTKKAISIFNNMIPDILSGSGAMKLEAVLKPEEGKVEIDFKAKIDDAPDLMSVSKRKYRVGLIPESAGKVFVWPDFQSPQWNKYFYYSEFPANVTGVRMLPNFEGADFESISDEELKDMYLVKYPVNRVASNMHKYEILSSKTPLRSVSIRINRGGVEMEGGTLLLKTEKSGVSKTDSLYLKNLKSVQNLNPATVGIDFGSTNTCVYYRFDGGKDSIPVPFRNRRLALVGFDNPHLSLAQKDELYFISNEGTIAANGQIKSWLHEHDPQYLTSDGDVNSIVNLDTEIVGGIPVNEGNIPVIMMDEHTVKTNAGVLHYNMKWLSAGESRKRKKAFMRMLWIQICADMAEAGAYPVKLNWSFPSAMSRDDVNALSNIYYDSSKYPFEAAKMRPVSDSYTESEAVCGYAIYKKTHVNASSLSLGIDVGGSTSDILILGSRNNKNALMTQSSIRLAGGFFFNAINSSEKFRRALYKFHESHRTSVKVLNISDVISTDPQVYKRAPYYLNNIFDQLHNSVDFERFYDYLYNEVPAIFALPAYVTGVLLYYSGKLVRNVVVKNGLDSIREVHARYYGKGGRLFEWLLDKYENDALKYYRRCFIAGYGSNEISFILDNFVNEEERINSKIENKSEVAIGLVCDNFMHIDDVKDESGERIIDNFDIIGEKGLMFTKPGEENRLLDDMEIIPDEIFDGGINVSFPDKMENFNEFLDIFLQFIELDSGGIISDIKELDRGKDNLTVLADIQNDPEYKKYLEEKRKTVGRRNGVSYKMPIFIAAALSYLNNTLLPVVTKQI